MISIIVPVYNVECYLERCLESLTGQTYAGVEILLIDDGSVDGSARICDSWKEKDPRIRVFHKENGGVSSARNLGLEQACGEYLFFADADDWLDAECLQEMLSRMQEDVDIVSCDFRTEKEGQSPIPFFSSPEHYGKRTKEQCIQDYYESKLYMKVVWGKLYKKALWDGIRFPDLAYSEDTYAMFEAVQQTRNLYLMEQKYYHYLQRAGGASHKRGTAYYEDTLVTLLYNYRKAVESYPEFAQRAAQDYIKSAYALLKCYVQQREPQRAKELIRNMQKIKKETLRGKQIRSIKLLSLPAGLLYLLLILKNE